MVTKVLDHPEIWRIQVDLPQNPLKYLNCYVLPHEENPLIIDTGFNRPECWEALCNGLELLHVDPNRASLFLTHLHGDHTGLANRLDALGCTIYMGRTDHDYLGQILGGEVWPKLESRFRQEGFPEQDIAAQRTANQARLYAADCLFPAIPVADGDRLSFAGMSFTAIATPGHTKGHMCLYLENEQIMFTGDHVLFDITPNITCWLNMTDALADYLDSLQKIKRYPVKLAMPAHRESSMPLETRVEQIEAHHEVRLNNVINILRNEPGLNAFKVARRLPWSMRGKAWEDFPVTAKWFAMGETLSHIDHLLLQNRIKIQKLNGQNRYYTC